MSFDEEADDQHDQPTQPFTQYFLNQFKHGDKEKRIDAVYALMKLKEPAVVEVLIEALHDSELDDDPEPLREMVAFRLGCFTNPGIIARTIELATDPAEPLFVPLKIMEGWGIYTQPQVLELLLSFLNGHELALQRGAFWALRSFNDERAFRAVKEQRNKRKGQDKTEIIVNLTPRTYSFAVSSSYRQFYIGDQRSGENFGYDETWAWTEKASNDALAVAPDFVAIGTASYSTVPVDVVISNHDPGKVDFAEWDQIAECSIQLDSGKLLIDGCMEYKADSPFIGVEPRRYQVRIYYGGLGSEAFDSDSRDDYYKIVLWPGIHIEPKVVKRFRQPDENGRGW